MQSGQRSVCGGIAAWFASSGPLRCGALSASDRPIKSSWSDRDLCATHAVTAGVGRVAKATNG